jgi:vitamin B12 transporter
MNGTREGRGQTSHGAPGRLARAAWPGLVGLPPFGLPRFGLPSTVPVTVGGPLSTVVQRLLQAAVYRLLPVTVPRVLMFALLLFPLPAAGQIRPIELEGFIVTGTPVPRAVGTEGSHVTILDGEELRLRGRARMADVLAEVPGLVVVGSGSYGSVTSVFFRGAESDHVKVLVDGVEMNQAGGGIDLAGLAVWDVERVEVVRGPASALYGSSALAGVIHIITRRGRGPPAVSVSGGLGSYGRQEWSAGLEGATASTGYALSLSRTRSDGILELNNQSENLVVSGGVQSRLDGATRVSLSGRYSDRTYHFPTDGAGNVVDRNAFSFGDEMALAAEAIRMLFPRVEVRAAVSTYGWDGGSQDEPDGPADTLGFYGFSSLDAFRRTSADLRSSLTPWNGLVVSAGVQLEQARQRSFSESLSEFGPSTGRSHYRRSNRAYYAHLMTEAPGWAGNAGFRVEDNEQYGSFFTYQAGVSYLLAPLGTRVRASLGRGFKEPTFLETSATGYTVGNPDLRPERSRAWDAGLEQPLGGGASVLSVTWFRQSLYDLIQYTFLTPEPGGPNFFNVARARIQGLEADARVAAGALGLSGGYTYLSSRVLDAGFDEGDGAVFVEGASLIRRPRHQVSGAATYRFSRASVSGGFRWVGLRHDRDFSVWPAAPVDLPAYTLLRLAGEVDVVEAGEGRPAVSLHLRGENLLGEEYQEVLGFRAPGRSLVVGGRVRFGGRGG